MRYDRSYLAEIIKDGLRNEIGPLLGPGRERLVLQTACELIDDLAGRDYVDETAYPAECDAEIESLAATLGLRRGSIGETLAALVAHAERADAPVAARIRALMTRIVEAQTRRLHGLPSLQDAGELSASGTVAGQPPARPTVASQLRDHFARRSPLPAEWPVHTVRRLSAGMSKETYVATFRHADGGERRLIVRKDGLFSSLMTTVRDEYPLLMHLRERGLEAVPVVIACEEDPAICGAPFMIVEPIPGAADPAQWNNCELLRGIALQMAGFLARLHAIPTDAFVANTPYWLDPPRMCRSVAGLRAAWARVGVEPQPLMHAVLDWLERNEPRAGRQVIVHGDVGLYNTLIDDGRIAGVLDWEMSHLGHPEEDLLSVRNFAGDALTWEELLAAYRAHGGQVESSGGAHFYRVFALARIALSLFNIMHSARNRDPALDTKEAYIGPRFAHPVLLDAFRLITLQQ